MPYQVISFYKYVLLEVPEKLREKLRTFCENNQILGRILLGKEGINGAVCSTITQVELFKKFLTTNPLFTDLTFREQESKDNSYHKPQGSKINCR